MRRACKQTSLSVVFEPWQTLTAHTGDGLAETRREGEQRTAGRDAAGSGECNKLLRYFGAAPDPQEGACSKHAQRRQRGDGDTWLIAKLLL